MISSWIPIEFDWDKLIPSSFSLTKIAKRTQNVAALQLSTFLLQRTSLNGILFFQYKMNTCLEKPCPWGFAFHDVVKHQVDFYGGFRCV
jgi:hypothetical protein